MRLLALILQAISLAKELGKAAIQERALTSLVQLLSVSDEHVAEFIKSVLSALNLYFTSAVTVCTCSLLYRIGGTLHRLAGIFSGHVPQLQLLAAQCITNMAASSHAERLLTPIGPYLVAFVSSPYLALKVSCILSTQHNTSTPLPLPPVLLKSRKTLQAIERLMSQ